MDVWLSECRGLNFRLRIATRLKHLGEVLALPAEAAVVGLEVLKFLATLALIAVYGLILLMLG